MMKENLIKIYERSFIDNWELPALTDYNTGERLTYGDFARNIARLHLLFKNSGVKQGDRIALIGKNIPNWVTIFMGTITYGAVIVPILQEFNPADAQHIINADVALIRAWMHSDALAAGEDRHAGCARGIRFGMPTRVAQHRDLVDVYAESGHRGMIVERRAPVDPRNAARTPRRRSATAFADLLPRHR
jgi:long-subunit acyl-CoA synthetase (AMP-forming)